jgi:hypothetical protein
VVWGNKRTSQRSCKHPAEVGRGTKAERGGRATVQPPKAGQVVYLRADLIGQRAVFKTELPHLTRGGADQTVAAGGQCSCCLVKTTMKITTALTTIHEVADLPHLPIATNPVDRRNQILLTFQSITETTSELPLVHQYQIAHLRDNYRTLTKRLNFLL